MTTKIFRAGMLRSVAGSLAAIGAATAAWPALAQGMVGAPRPGQISLPESVTVIGHEIDFFHNAILLPIITVICLFVLALLIYIVLKFNARANPVPSKTTHHALLEVAWTVVPVLILLGIAIPSFRLLNHQLIIPDADLTVKVTGNASWAWTYSYPKDEGGGFEFQSRLLDQDTLAPGKLRLLDVDNEAVVPVNKVVRMQVTADVVGIIHSFVVPAFGVRIDAVPGRLNETWFKAEKEGIYYGQCSKLCGKDHAYMPIVFRVVSEEAYKAWLLEGQKKFAAVETPVRLAATESNN
ncbi:cytochrome c oxidase subunit II [Methylocella sp. CPCC 101449]|uniref:cytochrome c oxidase subunit II n=1 Tax=Methylocella sp. CPCC 101449 TaxID=2987531 RepID=UPI003908B98C